MKVGTDGVLLGAWCRVNPRRDEVLLDMGTGTGVIALQLAQRTESVGAGAGAVIEAVEIDPAACGAARRNFEASGWAGRLVMHPPVSVQEFARTTQNRFDRIVSNPPYFTESPALPDTRRNTARHTASLSYDDLVRCCFGLLNPAGRLSLILPAGAATRAMIAAAVSAGFLPSRLTEVHSTPRSGPRRTLVEFSRAADITLTALRTDGTTRSAVVPESTSLTIGGNAPGTFSEEYRALTRDFYLNL
jgi:tRNA1Val (adenine37-N6)-methyltransferase